MQVTATTVCEQTQCGSDFEVVPLVAGVVCGVALRGLVGRHQRLRLLVQLGNVSYHPAR